MAPIQKGPIRRFRIFRWRVASWRKLAVPSAWHGFWALLFPDSLVALGFTLWIAEDGEWRRDGAPMRGVYFPQNGRPFISFVLGKWMLKVLPMGARKEEA